MISGTAGTGKSSSRRVLRRGLRPRRAGDVLRPRGVPGRDRPQHASVGIDLRSGSMPGCCMIESVRPSLRPRGAPRRCCKLGRRVQPVGGGDGPGRRPAQAGPREDASAISRQVDFLKGRGVTALITTLAHGDRPATSRSRSSLVDTWLLLNHESNGEHNRLLYVFKSRGRPTPTRSASSCSPTRASSSPTSTSDRGRPHRFGRGKQRAEQRTTARQEDLERRRRLPRPVGGGRSADAPLWPEFEDEAPSFERSTAGDDRVDPGRRGRRVADDGGPTLHRSTERRRRSRDESVQPPPLRRGPVAEILRALANSRGVRRAPRGPLRDRGDRPGATTRPWRAATTSSPSRRWCARCRNRCARSSATSPTPTACWSASGAAPCARAFVTSDARDLRWSLTLYVSGASPRSAEAIATVCRICDSRTWVEWPTSTVVNAHRASGVRVIQPPHHRAALRSSSVPPNLARQLVGDLTDPVRLCVRLGLDLGPASSRGQTSPDAGMARPKAVATDEREL